MSDTKPESLMLLNELKTHVVQTPQTDHHYASLSAKRGREADPFKSRFKLSEALDDIHSFVGEEARAEANLRARVRQQAREDLETQQRLDAQAQFLKVEARLRREAERQAHLKQRGIYTQELSPAPTIGSLLTDRDHAVKRSDDDPYLRDIDSREPTVIESSRDDVRLLWIRRVLIVASLIAPLILAHLLSLSSLDIPTERVAAQLARSVSPKKPLPHHQDETQVTQEQASPQHANIQKLRIPQDTAHSHSTRQPRERRRTRAEKRTQAKKRTRAQRHHKAQSRSKVRAHRSSRRARVKPQRIELDIDNLGSMH